MTKIILIRHGETKTNLSGKLHKKFDTAGLTKLGVKQIHYASNSIKIFSPSCVYSSKENRAAESAKIISSELNIPLKFLDGLEERNWGIYAGYSFEEIKRLASMDNMDFNDRFLFHPPEGESWKEAEERLINAVQNIINNNKDKTVVIVTHGGSIRILMPFLLDVKREESYKYDPDNASITIFEYKNDKFKNIIYNDTNHLKLLS